MATRNLIRLEVDDLGLAPGRRSARFGRRLLRLSERLLIVFGIVGVAYFLYAYVETRLYQVFEDRELDKILNSGTAAGPSGTESEKAGPRNTSQRAVPANGSMVGRIEIPRLGVSAVIRAGSDARTLRLAVGYIPGTALPGDPGNLGLAGHRDTFFRKLRDINPDDEIRIVTEDGVFTYHVERTTIVMPEDVWVLNPTNYPTLTLVTCYPFNYIGSAPKRFIVRAALATTQPSARSTLSSAADATATRTATGARGASLASATRARGASAVGLASPSATSTSVRAKIGTKKVSVLSKLGKSQRTAVNLQPKRSTAPKRYVRAKASVPPSAKTNLLPSAKGAVPANAKRARATATNGSAN
jgi:sortase A